MPRRDARPSGTIALTARSIRAAVHRSVLDAIALLMLGLVGAACAIAQAPGAVPAIEEKSAHWSLLLDLVTAELDKPQASPAVVEALRPQIETLQRDAAVAAAAAATDTAAIQQLLDALGPPPPEGEPPESAAVAAERAILEERRIEREGHLKQAELILTRARQVMERIAETRRERSTRRLLERGPSPLSWTVLSNAGPHALGVVRRLMAAPLDQWFPARGTARGTDWQPLPALALALVLTIVLVVPARRWMLRRHIRERDIGVPSFPRRIHAAILVGIARGVLPSLVGIVPLAFLLSAPAERGIAADGLVAAFGALAGIVLTGGIARAALAPYSPDGWRLAPLTGESARGLYRRIRALAGLVGALFFIEYLAARHLAMPRELAVFYRLLADGAVAGFVLLLLPAHLWRRREASEIAATPEPSEPGPLRIGATLRVAAAVAALSVPILSLAGFEPLAHYLAVSLVKTVVVLGLAAIAHGVTRDTVILALARRDAGTGAAGETEREGGTMLRFWLVVAIDTLIAIVAMVALLASWGFAWVDIKAGLATAVDGFRIGSFRLSITDLMFAVVIFVALLTATRWLQRLLETRVFPQTRLDAGMRNSLKSTVGYVGLIIAVAVAVSIAGLDLSNIAIIAGALSIGIGFGLQNIVNNFVSGLILLAERPIKIGDWIVVGEHEGFVQRINVRATEVRTFQHSSVIIPNSELLSSALVNWTHKDAMARIEIPVGVSYGADVDLVRDTLVEVAASHPEAMPEPEPYVLFTAFGDSSLDFELRCFTPQAGRRVRIATAMRFEIVRLFRERGIEIPFPQRDVHVRGLGGAGAGSSESDEHPRQTR